MHRTKSYYTMKCTALTLLEVVPFPWCENPDSEMYFSTLV